MCSHGSMQRCQACRISMRGHVPSAWCWTAAWSSGPSACPSMADALEGCADTVLLARYLIPAHFKPVYHGLPIAENIVNTIK
jgi:hypothetical protein